jgi:hypothetical protein
LSLDQAKTVLASAQTRLVAAQAANFRHYGAVAKVSPFRLMA